MVAALTSAYDVFWVGLPLTNGGFLRISLTVCKTLRSYMRKLPITRRKAYTRSATRHFFVLTMRPNLIVFADADTVWLQRPDRLFEIVHLNHAIAGCIAHFPPPEPSENTRLYWEELFQTYVGSPPAFDHACSLKPHVATPFYVNFAFVVADSDIMRRYGKLYVELAQRMRSRLKHPYFSYQIALTLWAAKLKLNVISIPIRYNFPNDDAVYEFVNFDQHDIVVFHYLREVSFRRGTLFNSLGEFRRFITAKKGRADMLFADLCQNVLEVEKWLQPRISTVQESWWRGKGR
jgi:hypothetical protein